MALKKQPKSQKKKSRKVVCFDEEIVTKESAGKFLVSEPASYKSKNNAVDNAMDNAVDNNNLQNGKSDLKRKKRKEKKYNDADKATSSHNSKSTVVDSVKLGSESPNEDDNAVDNNNLQNVKFNIKRKKRKEKKSSGADEATSSQNEISAVDSIKLGIESANEDDNAESNNLQTEKSVLKGKKLKRKKIREVDKETESNGYSDKETDTHTELKIKRKKKTVNEEEKVEAEKEDEIALEKPEIKQKESIRAQKRKKHAKLLEDKRLKAELAAQQNALNYLSLWKHNRTEWKFEKLKQIWLQQNLFDSSKLPDEFWDTVTEYFCGSKGAIRNVILKKAVEIIEKEEKSEEENVDETYLLTLKRARDIVQNLQE